MADANARWKLLRARVVAGEPECGYNKDGVGLSKPAKADDYFLGCLLMSYLVSAPLHFQGHGQFWTRASWCMGRLIALLDLFCHLALWITVFVLECWTFSFETLGTDQLNDVRTGSFWCTLLAVIGLLMAVVYGALGQPAGKAWPSTIGMVIGGGVASLIFSFILALWSGAVVLAADEERTAESVRHVTFWLIALKTFALAVVNANINFWGACEQADQLSNICALMSSKKMPSAANYAANLEGDANAALLSNVAMA